VASQVGFGCIQVYSFNKRFRIGIAAKYRTSFQRQIKLAYQGTDHISERNTKYVIAFQYDVFKETWRGDNVLH
jgi:hypothetical protein